MGWCNVVVTASAIEQLIAGRAYTCMWQITVSLTDVQRILGIENTLAPRLNLVVHKTDRRRFVVHVATIAVAADREATAASLHTGGMLKHGSLYESGCTREALRVQAHTARNDGGRMEGHGHWPPPTKGVQQSP